LSDIHCPFCDIKPKESTKKWEFTGAHVSRFHCECGKFFNYYEGKTSSWTISKKKSWKPTNYNI